MSSDYRDDFYYQDLDNQIVHLSIIGRQTTWTIVPDKIIPFPNERTYLVGGTVIFRGAWDNVLSFTESFHKVSIILISLNRSIIWVNDQLATLEKEDRGKMYKDNILFYDLNSQIFKLVIMGLDSSDRCWTKFLYILSGSSYMPGTSEHIRAQSPRKLYILYEHDEELIARHVTTIDKIQVEQRPCFVAIIDGLLCYHSPTITSKRVSFIPTQIPAYELCSSYNSLMILDQQGLLYELLLPDRQGYSSIFFSPSYWTTFPHLQLKFQLDDYQANLLVVNLTTLDEIRHIGLWRGRRIYLHANNSLVIHGLVNNEKDFVIVPLTAKINYFEFNGTTCVMFGDQESFLLQSDLTLARINNPLN